MGQQVSCCPLEAHTTPERTEAPADRGGIAPGSSPLPSLPPDEPVEAQPPPTGRLGSELVSVRGAHSQQSVAEVQVESLLSRNPADHLPARWGRSGVTHCPRQASEPRVTDAPISQARREDYSRSSTRGRTGTPSVSSVTQQTLVSTSPMPGPGIPGFALKGGPGPKAQYLLFQGPKFGLILEVGR